MDAVNNFRKISYKILVSRTSLCEGFAISHLMSCLFMPILMTTLIIFSTKGYAINDPVSNLREHFSALLLLRPSTVRTWE